jgi:hypothetical protein
MKTNRFACFLTVFSLTAFSTAGCAEKAKPAEAALPVKPAAAATPPAAAEVPTTSWSDLKDYTYDQRDLFLTGLKGLEARVDAQITQLGVKRAALDASNTSTQAWDLAMKEMSEARTSLKSTSEDMAKATRENWDQLKEKVSVAWTRTQDAFSKVQSSTTI